MEQSLRLKITGMSCADCSLAVESTVGSAKGVRSVYVSLSGETAVLVYDDTLISKESIIKRIEDIGYKAADERLATERALDRLKTSLIVSAVLSMPMVIGMLFILIPTQTAWINSIFHNEWVQLALAAPVQFIIGYRFYRGTASAIKSGKANMDALIMFGTTAAFGYSIYNMIIGKPEFYFESSSVIITLTVLGSYLEMRERAKASLAIAKLLELRPKTAVLVKEGDMTEEIGVDALRTGDIVLILPGERVPSDGVVSEGGAQVDESMISGNTTAVFKKEGDTVVGGTINRFGRIKVKITQTGKETVLYKIIELVFAAQAAKAPPRRPADAVAKVYVPAVMIIAIITFIIGFFATPNIAIGIMRAVSVLIIACPCALGVASWAAVLAGINIAGEKGVLVKSGELLEHIYKADTVVFDKTGTITLGRPSVTDVIPVADIEFEELVSLAGIAEKFSEHIVGKAIYEYAKTRFFVLGDPKEFEAVSDIGIKAVAADRQVIIGTRRILYKYDIDTTPHESKIIGLERLGKTAVIMAVDGEVAAVIGISDTIKPDSKAAIEKLRHMGKSVFMLTGDNEYTADAVAAEAGIDKEHIVFGVLPEDKFHEIRKLKEQGRLVMMVGDGINDVPCIAEADIGVAMGSGTDAAVDAADVVLTGGSLKSVVTAFRISRATLRKIRQNIFWALVYHLIGILFAVSGLLSPVIAAAVILLGGISVLLNSFSLGRIKKRV